MKVDEIKQSLADYYAAHQQANEYFVRVAKAGKFATDFEYSEGKRIIQPASDKLCALAPDALRLLLPIVEAAKKLASFGFESSDIYGHGDEEEVKEWQATQDALIEALNALYAPK